MFPLRQENRKKNKKNLLNNDVDLQKKPLSMDGTTDTFQYTIRITSDLQRLKSFFEKVIKVIRFLIKKLTGFYMTLKTKSSTIKFYVFKILLLP